MAQILIGAVCETDKVGATIETATFGEFRFLWEEIPEELRPYVTVDAQIVFLRIIQDSNLWASSKELFLYIVPNVPPSTAAPLPFFRGVVEATNITAKGRELVIIVGEELGLHLDLRVTHDVYTLKALPTTWDPSLMELIQSGQPFTVAFNVHVTDNRYIAIQVRRPPTDEEVRRRLFGPEGK